MKRIGNGLTGFFISKGLISLKYTLRYEKNWEWINRIFYIKGIDFLEIYPSI